MAVVLPVTEVTLAEVETNLSSSFLETIHGPAHHPQVPTRRGSSIYMGAFAQSPHLGRYRVKSRFEATKLLAVESWSLRPMTSSAVLLLGAPIAARL